LPGVVDDPSDLTARTQMLEGAVLGGRCLHNARMGVHHALAQLLGGRTGISHGLANAIILAPAVRWTVEVIPSEARRLGVALGDEDRPADAIDSLRQRLGLPGHLEEAGVTEEDLEAVIRMASSHRGMAGSPRPVTDADIRGILEEAW
jgi:alcohol dehydrogenase class IV